MLDITVVILTKDERVHIRRCLERLQPLEAERVVVVDSLSTDGTQDMARELGAEVVEHRWPGNQAEQFNWAIDNINVSTQWILRLDADEYLTPELIAEIQEKLPSLPPEVTAVVFPLGRAFMGRVLRHGIVNDVSMIRMFRSGKARYENRAMDEHIKVMEGETRTFRHRFIDDNRMPLTHFIAKHNGYADREASLILAELQSNEEDADGDFAAEVKAKRAQKARYNRMPMFWRAFGYFIYRYIFRLGFLDGKEGFLWDFLQGFWYRTLVDAKVLELKQKASDKLTKVNSGGG